MVGRRMFMKGAAGAAVVGPQVAQEALRGVQQGAIAYPPNIPYGNGVSREMMNRATDVARPAPHIPDELWDLREQYEERINKLDSPGFDSRQRVQMRYAPLKSVKDSAKLIYITRDIVAEAEARTRELGAMIDNIQTWCDKINAYNPFGSARRQRKRIPEAW